MQAKQRPGLLLLLIGISGCGGGTVGVVSIDPSRVILGTGQQQVFTVTVTQCSGTQVNWSVDENAAGGSVSSDGVYTAPSETGIYDVRAACASDTRVNAVAEVTVN